MDFAAAIQARQQDLRALQILACALLSGAVMFLGVVLVLPQLQGAGAVEASEEGAQLIQMLCLAQVFVSPTCWATAFVLYRMRLGQLRVHPEADAGGVLDDVFAALRVATILALALFEGPALFGIVTLFLAQSTGVIAHTPYAWGGLLSTLVMATAVIALFPTARRVEGIAREASERAQLEA